MLATLVSMATLSRVRSWDGTEIAMEAAGGDTQEAPARPNSRSNRGQAPGVAGMISYPMPASSRIAAIEVTD